MTFVSHSMEDPHLDVHTGTSDNCFFSIVVHIGAQGDFPVLYLGSVKVFPTHEQAKALMREMAALYRFALVAEPEPEMPWTPQESTSDAVPVSEVS